MKQTQSQSQTVDGETREQYQFNDGHNIDMYDYQSKYGRHKPFNREKTKRAIAEDFEKFKYEDSHVGIYIAPLWVSGRRFHKLSGALTRFAHWLLNKAGWEKIG